MSRDHSATPNTVPWPPLVYAGAAVLAWLLHRAMPLPPGLVLAFWPPAQLFGAALIALGLGFDLWAMVTMWRHRANILPHRAATALVTHGPFAWSRNPIYLGNTILLAGVGFAAAIPWFLPLALAAAVTVAQLAIVREEAHLNARFGRAWRNYAATTSRWLGRRSTRG